MTPTETVFKSLGEVVVGDAVTCKNLSSLPLVASGERPADYLVLDEALARGWVEITETGKEGHVPEWRVTNRGDTAVLLLDGEELLGAKQNRVLNLSILVPPQTTCVIPVSCVESGRWQRVSDRFAAAPGCSSPKAAPRRCGR